VRYFWLLMALAAATARIAQRVALPEAAPPRSVTTAPLPVRN
jgi:hypothetical protein